MGVLTQVGDGLKGAGWGGRGAILNGFIDRASNFDRRGESSELGFPSVGSKRRRCRQGSNYQISLVVI